MSHIGIYSSWHVSLSLAYLPAWIIVALVWRYQLFVMTSVWLILVINILTGFVTFVFLAPNFMLLFEINFPLLPRLSLASWSFFIAAPFEKSPQLAAVAATFISILFSILGETFNFSNGIAFIFIILFPASFFSIAIKTVAQYEQSQISTNALHSDPALFSNNTNTLLTLMIAALVRICITIYSVQHYWIANYGYVDQYIPLAMAGSLVGTKYV